ncbi:MAG: ketopantoate reductase family protein [Gammaproteobacteria bacterium]|nr:MAG: ketopantoate reductase family protein [Gammaproteobacteria bacterium]
MRFVILGTGGLGSVIGGYLAKAGEDVTFIGRQAHMDAINKDGLKIDGCRGEFHITENMTGVTSPDDAEGEFDYLILLVKGKDTETALGQADKLKERCKNVLSLQNGIGKEIRLTEWAGDKVIGASTIEGGTLHGPGHASNPITTPTTAYFGELDGGITPRIEAITDAFNRAGLGAKSMEDIYHVLWEKLVQIGTASGWSVSTLAGGDLYFADGLGVREGAEHYVALARDLLKVYGALGYEPQNFYAPMSQFRELNSVSDDKAVEIMLALGEKFNNDPNGRSGRTSMHEDVIRGRKTEVDEIIKPFLVKADELGIEIPTAKAVYRIIKVLDNYLTH